MTPEEIAELRAEKYNATVVRLRKVHPDLMIMRVRPDFPRPPTSRGSTPSSAWATGSRATRAARRRQLDELMLPRLARRSYSISCSVLDDGGELLDIDRHRLAGVLRRPGPRQRQAGGRPS